MKSQSEKFELAQALYELIENHGAEYGIHLNQDPDDMNTPEVDVIFKRVKFTVECK